MLFGLSVAANSKDHYGYGGRFGVFYSSLSSYGEWIDCDFGYVWRPLYVAHGWRPYVHGRWVWTSYGWYWVSYEPFGWATFHYGRWQYDDYYGWIWVPDEVWGPAWVEWRYDDDYIGWAPLPPQATFSFSVGISYASGWQAPIHYWSFVPCRNFTTTRIVDYVQPVERTRRIFGSTRHEVNISSDGGRIVNRGVDVNFVERRGNTRINRVEVVERERDRGNGDRVVRESNRERVEIFRPHLDNQTRGEESRPTQVRRAERPIRIEGFTRERSEQRDQEKERSYDRQDRTPPAIERNTRSQGREMREQQQNDRRIESRNRPEQERPRNYNREAERNEQRKAEQRSHERQATEDRGRGKTERQSVQPRGQQQEQPQGREKKEQRERGGRRRP